MSAAILLAACCCDESPPAGTTSIAVYCYREVASRRFEGWYVGDTPDTPPSGVDWSCDYTVSLSSGVTVNISGHDYYLQGRTYTTSQKSRWFAERTWTLPYVDTTTASRTVAFKINATTSTSISVGIVQDVDNYTQTFADAKPCANSSASGCFRCVTEDGTAASVTIDASYYHPATYSADVVAFQVYGSSGTYAAWTGEVTGSDFVVKDGGGTVQYTWALASYTLTGLRSAINATAELVASGGAVSASSAIANADATELPAQGPTALSTSGASGFNVALRLAGTAFETWQATGEPYYTVDDGTLLIVPNGRYFTGSYVQFANGCEYRWTDAEVRAGTAMTMGIGGADEGYGPMGVTFSEAAFDCDDGLGTLYEPPILNTLTDPGPWCSDAGHLDPVGGAVRSLPSDAPFTLGNPGAGTYGTTYPLTTTPYQEVLSGGVWDEYGPMTEAMHICGTASTQNMVNAGFKTEHWGARAKWKLTRT